MVNRWSTAGFVAPSVLHTNLTVRASEESFRTVFSIPWRARGRVVFGPDRPNGVPSYPAPPSPAAPLCAAPTRPACGVSGFWIRQSMLWKVRWTFVSWANSSVGTQSCLTSPGRSAGRPDPTRPWYVRVLGSTGHYARYFQMLFFIVHLSNSKSENHGRVGSGGVRLSGGSRQDGEVPITEKISPTRKESRFSHPRASYTNILVVSSEARIMKSYFNRMRNKITD